jgi:hypothetical protein
MMTQKENPWYKIIYQFLDNYKQQQQQQQQQTKLIIILQ